ncbi:MAG: PQQ-dependent sugar dehydrogenase [Chitinophagaceae bacterium]|nr:PQQ-dependent sugar dehydrogenase [Chitinophagaceae bacterium]
MKMIHRPVNGTSSLILFFTSVILLGLLLIGCKKNDDIADTKVDLELVGDGFVSPLGVVASPDNTDRLFVFDQVGKIWIIDSTGNKLATPFMDITPLLVTLNPGYDERGLLGLAFHPQFATNRRFYVYYQVPPRAGGPTPTTNWNNLSKISEFRASTTNADIADMTTEKVLLQMDDPQSNHNGGAIAFGNDGYLYIAIGDGGSANDVAPGHVDDWYAANAGGNGQDVESNLFGDILRIDVNSSVPYGIPADNPFVGGPGRDEIYAYGFRNPYRMSFDMGGSNQLYVGDAGQVLYEEINLVTKGSNYGWNVKEGKVCFNAANNDTAFATCPAADNLGKTLIDPVVVINNTANPAGGRALTVIGGNVYRGSGIPAYEGKYIFGTFAQSGGTPNGELFISTPAGQNTWDYSEISLVSRPNDLGYYLKGFGQDNDGEIYLTVSTNAGPSGATGRVMKLVKVP